MKKYVQKYLGLLMATLLITALAAGCSSSNNETNANEEEEAVAFPVEIEKVELGQLTDEIKLPGNVMANELTAVMPLLTGEIKAIHVSNGDYVEKGDILVEIDATDIELSASQARAGLEAAQANLRSAKAMREQGIKQAEMQLQQTREMVKALKEAVASTNVNLPNMDNVPEELQSILQTLLAGNMPSEADVAQAERAVKQAEMAVEQAKSTAQIEAVEASVKQAEIGVQMAERQGRNAVVKAPISGLVNGLNSNVGQMVAPQMPLLQLVQMNNPVVHLNVNEVMLSRLTVGQNVDVLIKSLNSTYEAEITYIGILPAEQSRSYPVEIEIKNSDDNIRVGMVAEVYIDTADAIEQLILPINAVLDDNNEKVVYVTVDGERVERRVIDIQAETQNYLSINSGVREGEFIVVRGNYQLYDGALVNVRNEEVMGKKSNQVEDKDEQSSDK